MKQRMPKVETQELEARLSRVYSPPTSPLASPLIDRRPLTPTTEAELKAACSAVARDYKPTEDEILGRKQADARAVQLARAQLEDKLRKQQQAKHANAKFDAYPGATSHPPRNTYKPNAAWNDTVKEPAHSRETPTLTTANNGKQRESRQLKSSNAAFPPRRSSLLPPPAEVADMLSKVPDTQNNAGLIRQSSDSAPSTPRSASTDLRFGHPSTDPTSVAWSPERSSKHTSRSHLPIEAIPGPRTNPVSDAWFYREYKRPTPPEEESHPQVSNPKEVRSQSRGRKIKSQLGEYIKPSLPNNSTVSLGRISRPTSQMWKSWGPSKRASQPNLAEARAAAAQRGAEDTSRGRRKAQVNLNRELPPLPSLNQWQEPEQKPHNHIVALMQTRPRSRSRGRDSKRNTQGFQSTPNLHSGQEVTVAQAVTLRAFVGAKTDPCATTQDNSSRTIDRITSPGDAYDRYVGNVTQKRVDSAQQKGHHRQGTNSSSGSEARNFSRKLSAEQSSQQHDYIEITALPTAEPIPEVPPVSSPEASDKKGGLQGLTKMFGRLGRSRAATKSRPAMADGNWMDRVEARGSIRGGVLEFDQAAGAPVIRY